MRPYFPIPARAKTALVFYLGAFMWLALGGAAAYAQSCGDYSIVYDSTGCNPKLFIFKVFKNQPLPAGSVVQWYYSNQSAPSQIIGPVTPVQGDTLVRTYLAGTYKVRLQITLPGQAPCPPVEITVTSPPIPNVSVAFANSSQAVQCGVGSPVTLVASSESPGISYSWTIGANYNATGATVTYLPNQPGGVDVKVFASGPGFCTEVLNLPNFIEVFGTPNLTIQAADAASTLPVEQAFSANPIKGCVSLNFPLKSFGVKFRCLTQLPGQNIVSYSWQFPGGTPSSITGSSSLVSSTIQYGAVGVYDVSLTVTTDKGCVYTQTYANYVTTEASPPQPPNLQGFLGAGTVTCVNQKIGVEPVTPPNFSGTIGWESDGGTVTPIPGTNAAYFSASAAGTYKVFLVYSNGYCKSYSTPRIIQVNGVAVNFSAPQEQLYACAPPDTVNFSITNAAYSAFNLYIWQVIDTANNVIYEYVTNPPNSPKNFTYIFTQGGLYTIRLIAQSPNGCVDTLKRTGYVSIAAPKANFDFAAGYSSPICLGENVKIVSLTQPQNYPFTRNFFYRKEGSPDWVFIGAGTSRTFTPPGVGLYHLRHIVQNKNRCADTVTKNGFLMVHGVEGYIQASQNPNCAPPATATVNFVVTQQSDPNATVALEWIVSPSSGVVFSGGTGGNNNTITFNKAGVYSIKLGTTYSINGCKRVFTYDTLIRIGIDAQLTAPDTVCRGGSYPVSAQVLYNPGGAYLWSSNLAAEFYPSATALNPVVRFVQPGQHILRFQAMAPAPLNCMVEKLDTVFVRSVEMDFAADAIVKKCAPQQFTFTAFAPEGMEYTWIFGDGVVKQTNNPVIKHQFFNNGFYDITLVVKDKFNCVDTLKRSKYVQILGPTAGFSLSAKEGCGALKVTVTNTSKDALPDKTVFDPGDGSIPSINKFVNQTLEYQYVFPANLPPNVLTYTFYPILYTFDSENCQDSAMSVVTLYRKPEALLAVSDTVGCAPLAVQFTDQTEYVIERGWDFDDDGVWDATEPNPSYVFPNDNELHKVTLYVKQLTGCMDTVSQYVRTRKPPVSAFTAAPEVVCPGQAVTFTNLSIAGELPTAHYLWTFGDGQFSTEPNPVHFYSQAGVFTVSLSVFDEGGCIDISESVGKMGVLSPVARFSPDSAFMDFFPYQKTVQFQDSSLNADQWFWDFGDGTVSQEQNPAHSFDKEGDFMVTLVVQSPLGCRDTLAKGPFRTRDLNLYFNNVFTPNGDGVNDRFEVEFKGAKSISMRIFTRSGIELPVDFGASPLSWDGTVRGIKQPSDVYFVRLTIGDDVFVRTITLIR